jgi:hypothetical protein
MQARRNTETTTSGRDTVHPPGVGVAASLEGVALVVWNLLATPIIGRRRLRWGTVGTEAVDPLPGDELVPVPKWSYTLGVAVDAPAEAVWPWVAQIGQGRGGFYSYQSLENLVGCRITNTAEILPEHQHPAVGDSILLHPDTPPLRIELVDPPSALVLFGSPADIESEDRWGLSTWQFAVKPGSDGGTRLLTRGRYDYSADRRSRMTFGRFPLGAISFVMSRKMMLGIKSLAEHTA